MSQIHEIIDLLRKWSDGNSRALDKLLPVVYAELHRQAARFLSHERPDHTMQTTDLIHETYIKLVDQRKVNWKNRLHFFAISATLMRRVLINHANKKSRKKRGGNAPKIPLNEETIVLNNQKNLDLIALDEALDRLAKIDERKVRIVELKFFSGLTLEETAEVLKVSRSTVKKNWTMAKAWLHRELTR